MGLDVGDKKIGVAISDSLLLTAQGRPTIARKTLEFDLERLASLARDNEVTELVVGKPVHMDGRESPQSRKIRRFALRLSKTLGLPVTFWDERLTSFAAEQHLEDLGLNWRKRREQVDKIAAMFILQSYLDSRR